MSRAQFHSEGRTSRAREAGDALVDIFADTIKDSAGI
jgi:hypothetical protein